MEYIGSARRIATYPASRYVKRAGASEAQRQEAAERIKMVPVGLLGAHYQVLAWTNLDGATLPTRFRLTKYRPDDGRPGPKNSPIASTYEGRVTRVERASLESGLPDISNEGVWVVDLRLQDARLPADGIRYGVTNQWITSTNDARLRAAIDEELQEQQSLRKER